MGLAATDSDSSDIDFIRMWQRQPEPTITVDSMALPERPSHTARVCTDNNIRKCRMSRLMYARWRMSGASQRRQGLHIIRSCNVGWQWLLMVLDRLGLPQPLSSRLMCLRPEWSGFAGCIGRRVPLATHTTGRPERSDNIRGG